MVQLSIWRMGAHGHGHGPSVPDYRIYKVEDVPLLLRTQKALAAQGLRDPWLRNEVWRYDPKTFNTKSGRVKGVIFRGFKIGFTAFVLTIVGTAAYDKLYPSSHDQGHGEHH